MKQNHLVGTWRLASWENRSTDGQVTYPFGQNAAGYITYTEDGYMFVAMFLKNVLFFFNDCIGKGTFGL